MQKLSDTVDRKFIESFDASDWEVETEDGFKDIISSNKTIEYEVYQITLENGLTLKCADKHILIKSNNEEVFAINSLGCEIKTINGNSKVTEVISLGISENMYDLSIDSENHTYYTDGILSHNTTTSAAYILWYTLFQPAMRVAIVANEKSAAREVLRRYQEMYEELPFWMQAGVKTWNKGDIELDNKSIVITSATTANGIRGKSCNLVYIDEMAHIPSNIAEDFFKAIQPTISSGKTTKMIISSTPKGFNKFHALWKGAAPEDDPLCTDGSKVGKNGFVRFFVDHKANPTHTDEWVAEQRRNLGDAAFNQEVLCDFLGSSNTLIRGDTLNGMPVTTPVQDKDLLNTGYYIYDMVEDNHPYILICDPGKGLGEDYSTFQVIDLYELPYKQVAAYRNNVISPVKLPDMIQKAATYYNNAWVLVETNLSDQVPQILHDDLLYENILYVERGKGGQRLSTGYGSKSVYAGVATDTKVKRIGCDNIKYIIESNNLLIQDENTQMEFSTFVQTGSSYAADTDAHDDLVMPMVLFGWVTTNDLFKEISSFAKNNSLLSKIKEEEYETALPIGFFDNGDYSIDLTKLKY